jgi:hypothetical protein
MPITTQMSTIKPGNQQLLSDKGFRWWCIYDNGDMLLIAILRITLAVLF